MRAKNSLLPPASPVGAETQRRVPGSKPVVIVFADFNLNSRLVANVRSWLVLFPLALCGLVGCSADLDLHRAAAADADTVRDRVTDASTPNISPPAGSDRYIGVSTCASVGCHGFTGATNGEAPQAAGQDRHEHEAAWRTAYWKWQSDDPHAIAFDVLWRPRAKGAPDSRNIVAQLDPQAVKSKEQYSKFILQNCCGCHATGVAPTGAADGGEPPKSLALGVHCEACHGPARDWRKEHTLNSWLSLRQDKQEAAGHRTTRDLTVRASLCVECHIGSTSTPGQEVNHDLIAAGHPRLNFEFTVFLARLPAHWDEQSDRKWVERPSPAQKLDGRSRTNFELEAWHAGQLVSARQALRLLAGRADRAVKGGGPWPEFSEYDCFACHHDLNPAGFRQGKSEGIWSCTNWYTALSDHWLPRTGGSRDSLFQLQSLLEQQTQRPEPLRPLPPEPQDVFQAADSARSQLDSLLAGRPTFATPAGRAQLAKELASDRLPEPGWMEATQWLLAVTACVRSFDAAQAKAHAPELESLLQELENLLAFMPGLPGETPDAAEGTADTTINSPRIFDPTEPGYRQLITRIRDGFKKLVEETSRSGDSK